MIYSRFSGFSFIVKVIARVVARLMLLFGMYVVLHGQVTHGGGFAGGVIMALVFILMMIAFGKEASLKILSQTTALFLASAGLLLLLILAFAGYLRGHFFQNFMGPGWPYEFWSAGVIPFLNIAIALVVVGSLYGIFTVMILYRPERGRKQ